MNANICLEAATRAAQQITKERDDLREVIEQMGLGHIAIKPTSWGEWQVVEPPMPGLHATAVDASERALSGWRALGH